MIKKLQTLFIGIMLIPLIFTSCSEDDDEIVQEAPSLVAPVLTISDNDITIDEDKADETAITFSWTAADNDSDINTNYTFYVNHQGEEISEGVEADLGNSLDYSLTHAQLADLVNTEFGANSGETIDLEVVVNAADTDNIAAPVLSEKQSFTVTNSVYASHPASLFLVGRAYDQDWSIKNAAELSSTADGIYEVKDVPLEFGEPEDGNGIKLLLSNEEWHPFYAQDEEIEEFGKMKLYNEGEDENEPMFYPLEHGYESGIYTINANLNTLELSLTKTGEIEEETDWSEAIFMLGDATPFGWEFDKENAMTETSEGVYEYEKVYLSDQGGFKFNVGLGDLGDWNYFGRENPDDLDPYWTVKLRSPDEPDAQYFLWDAGLPSGEYHVVLDTNQLTLKLTPIEEPEEETDWSEAIFMRGDATPFGWEFEKENAMTETSEGVYEYEKVYISDQGGFKFNVGLGDLGDWNYYGRENPDDLDPYWTVKLRSDDEPDAQYFLWDAGLPSGEYHVVLDTNQLTLELTPIEEPTEEEEEEETDWSEAIFMLGDATPFGWEFDKENAMTETSEGVYEYEKVYLSDQGGFKFTVGLGDLGDWNYYGRENPDDLDPYWTVKLRSPDDPDAQYSLWDAGLPSGDYHVVLDTNQLTLEVTPIEED